MIQSIKDVLADEEVYASDQLRRIRYEDQGYGLNHEYGVTTSPLRLASIGEPVLRRSRPVGYDTFRVLAEHDYSNEQIRHLIRDILSATVPFCNTKESLSPQPFWNQAMVYMHSKKLRIELERHDNR